MSGDPCNNDETSTMSTFLSTSSTVSHGGFDYELLGGTDSRYECPICLLYMRNPVITSCGHRFCSACISQWVLSQADNNGCPVDGTKLSHEHIFPDNCTRREILDCKAKCPFLKDGCSAIMKLAEMDKHVDDHNHILSMSGLHNGLKALNGNVANGNNGTIECMFKEFGCVGVFPPEQYRRHLETDVHHHLQLCTASYKRLKKVLSRPPIMEYPHQREPFARQDSRDSGRWLLWDDADSEYSFRRQRSWDSAFTRRSKLRPHYPERLAESDESVSKHFQPPVPGKETGCSDTCHSTGNLSVSNGEDYHLKDLFERIVKLEQNDREKQIKIERLESQLSSAISLFSKVTCLMDDLTARYCNGTYVWKLTEFKALCLDMRKNNTRILTSPGFYTDTFGYKMCLRFNLTANVQGAAASPVDVPLNMDENTTVSLYVHFMQGEFDDAIPWPFQGKLELTIVHPTTPQSSLTESIRSKPDAAAFAKPTIPRNPRGIGYPDFCSLKQIFSDGFVRNDCLYFKILANTNAA